jgi:hypothetical protein
MSGAIFETWVVSEIPKTRLNTGLQTPLHYFRNKDQREVDLLIEADGLLHPVELKKRASPGRHGLACILSLHGLCVPLAPGAVVCMAPKSMALSRDPQVIAWPAGWM